MTHRVRGQFGGAKQDVLDRGGRTRPPVQVAADEVPYQRHLTSLAPEHAPQRPGRGVHLAVAPCPGAVDGTSGGESMVAGAWRWLCTASTSHGSGCTESGFHRV